LLHISQISRPVTTLLLCSTLLCWAVTKAVHAETIDDPQTDLGVTKTGPEQADANSNVTYQIILANNGPDNADNATMTDTLPAGLTFVSLDSPSGWSCTTPGAGTAGTITCTHPSLTVTPNEVFTLIAHTDSAVTPGNFITNKASVTTTTPDINEENNESAASIQIAGGTTTDLGISMTADKESALAGDNVTYSITVTGSSSASSVSLNDPLPAGMTFVSLTSPAGWTCTHPSPGTGGNVNCSIGTLSPTTGQAFSLTINIPSNTVDETVFTNSATITTATPDVNSENDAASTSTAVQANYVISATAGTGQNTSINSTFAIQLRATVTLAGMPKSGVTVTFQAPVSGPSGTFTNTTTTETVTTDNNGLATISAFTANSIAGGPYNVTATTGNSAASATFALTNTKGSQTINFSSVSPKTYGDPPLPLIATASSNLPVSFSLISGPATLNGATVTILAPGTITIRASQAGDANYNAATPVDRMISVLKAIPAVTVATSKTPSEFGEPVTFTATITGPANTAAPTGAVQFKDGGSNLGAPVTCIAGGNTCTAQLSSLSLTSGTHTISASYPGDTNFTPAVGTLSGGQAVKLMPSISINDISLVEGSNGTTKFDFTISLSSTSSLTIHVDYATANNTATLVNNDYQQTNGTLTFIPGEQTKTLTILVNGDLNRELDETFFVNLTSPSNAAISKTPGTGTIVNDDTLDPPQLILDESGPSPNQAAALDSILFLRDPFPITSAAEWLDLGADRNTRVVLFATNLNLTNEPSSAIVISLVGSNSQSYEIPAEDVRLVPNTSFTQVIFRLPDSLVAGDALVTVKAHGQFSNSAVIRIK